jgi:peptidoglycan/LPS O-acetylase OafA/YrhL
MHHAGLDSGVDLFFFSSGQVITTAAPDKNYELQKLKKLLTRLYCISFYLAQ